MTEYFGKSTGSTDIGKLCKIYQRIVITKALYVGLNLNVQYCYLFPSE